MTAAGTAISLHDVRKTFPPSKRGASPRRALDGVSIDVPQGQWLALLGPNGCGKSTLLKSLSLTHAPDSGAMSVLGVPDLHNASSAARRGYLSRLGMVFQEPALDDLLTVRENLSTQAALVGLTGDDALGQIATLSERLGITARLDERVKTLSGGLRRRTDLARALLHRPELLLLDEATTGLDLAARIEFWDLIRSLRQQHPSMTIVATTHLMEEAECAQMVAMMSRGKVVRVGSPAEIRASIGNSVIRVTTGDDDARVKSLLAQVGVASTSNAGILTCAVAEPSLAAEAARTLAASGIAFEFGPPTLGDAYLALTGDTLAAAASAETEP
jgi:ABC-type multidrug transport system ATPase subunit